MRKRIIRILIAILILTPIAVNSALDIAGRRAREVQAVDPLLITYNNAPTPNPVFTYSNMLPGDEITEEVKVKNNLGSGGFNVSMDGIMTDETTQFADILEIIITEVGFGDIYGGTAGFSSLQNFLDELPIDLGAFSAGEEKTYNFKVKFPSLAGNEYQLAKVVFDLIFETSIESQLPPECEHLAGVIVDVFEGTEGDDDIHSNIYPNLILAKGGNDIIDSSASGDCVVAGDGNDIVRSESGDDVVLGGGGNDTIESGSDNDTVYGGEGDDNIMAGSGNDKVFGGPGVDTISGGSGIDELYGEAGNDIITGGGSNDFLDGGTDSDNLNGDSGTDTCIDGETLTSCEL